MREYRSLAVIILAIFIITLLGAYFSPTFTQQQSYLELFFLMGSVLFIIASLVVASILGFGSFAIYGALFLAAVMGIYGIEGALLLTGMSYLIWGGVFCMEILLFYYSIRSAQEWFTQRYTLRTFTLEYKIFYPMLFITYLFLEIIPAMIYKESFLKLSPSKIMRAMEILLKK